MPFLIQQDWELKVFEPKHTKVINIHLIYRILLCVTFRYFLIKKWSLLSFKIRLLKFEEYFSLISRYRFGVFRGFLRNSHKYGLGSLRKTPPPWRALLCRPKYHMWAMGLNPITQPHPKQ